MIEPSAAHPSSPWMVHLERAHALAHEAAWSIEEELEPSAHLEPAARQIEQAVTALYDAFDGRTDRPTAIAAAQARLSSAAVLVANADLSRAVAPLHAACEQLIAAQERFPLVPLAGRTPIELRAGLDLPALHVIERASLSPSFRAPPVPEVLSEPSAPDLPEPTTFEDLAAAAEAVRRLVEERTKALTRPVDPGPKKPASEPEDVPPGFALAPPKGLDDGAFLRRWARECFEEIGMLGIQRAPLPGDDWRSCIEIEKRLVRALDALAALGPAAIAHVESLAMDAPAPDPMRVFAVTMIGGCLEGRDALGAAERVLHRFGAGEKVVAGAFVAALKLAPNPFVPGVLRSLLASSDRACRAIAVEVLAYRGWLTSAEMEALAGDDDPRVLALLLPALAAVRHRDLDWVLSRAHAHSDLPLREAALDAMAHSAHPNAAAEARAAAQGALGERALVRLALVAAEDDARWLLSRMQQSPTPAAIEAVGWAGLVEAVPTLMKVLESGEDDAKLAAGAALERMLGAKLVENIEIQPEAIEEVEVVDPDPEPPPPRPTLAQMVSHPRDLPCAGSSETLEVASIDPAQWRAYWAEHGRRYDSKHRVRRGQAYSPSVSLYELDRLALAPEDRRRLHRELAARTGRITHFDPHDFVVAQEGSLKAWGALIAIPSP